MNMDVKKSRGRHSRHESINDTINRALCSANIPSIREPPGCSREDGKKPDGMTLVPWSHGKCLLWDFTCADTYAKSYISKTSLLCGSAAELREHQKKKKYRLLETNFIFIPVSIESSGSWGPQALSFIRKIGRKLIEYTGEPKSCAYLIQRISIAIQRGNAASILGTLPSTNKLDELFSIL